MARRLSRRPLASNQLQIEVDEGSALIPAVLNHGGSAAIEPSEVAAIFLISRFLVSKHSYHSLSQLR